MHCRTQTYAFGGARNMKSVRLCAVSCLAILMSTAAMAECSSGDVVGDWVLTTVPSPQSWMKCQLVIGEDGNLAGSSSCKRRGRPEIRITGSIQGRSNCQIEGSFVIGSQHFSLVDVNMNIDQSIFAGIAALGPSFIQFQALKR